MKKGELERLLGQTKLSDAELKAILHSKPSTSVKTYDHSNGRHVRFLLTGDWHIGHKEFRRGLVQSMGKVARKEGINVVYHAGDICEGMSGRPGHVYQLNAIGFENQVNLAAQVISEDLKGIQVYGITGNHDDWFKLKNDAGANVGKALEDRVDNFTYLGENEADINFGQNVVMRLFHPGDGTAYATSYKLQKLIESYEGGKKPNIVGEGHYHKALYMFVRNVHGFEVGTACGQTEWMKGKKIAAHMGFWELDLKLGHQGIVAIKPTFYPAYD